MPDERESDRATVACTACGEQLPGDAKYCGACGFKLTPIVLPAPSALGRIQLKAARVPRTRGQGDAKQRPAADAFAETMLSMRPAQDGAGQPYNKPRAYRRFPMKVEVGFHSAHNFFSGRTENISIGGLFVATPEPSEVGELLELQFTLPGLDLPLTVRCEVKWIRRWGEPGTPAPGMGLRFQALDEQTEQAIAAFLLHREPLVIQD